MPGCFAIETLTIAESQAAFANDDHISEVRSE
jgi:hypothetical protein